jgi:hypothetical protein
MVSAERVADLGTRLADLGTDADAHILYEEVLRTANKFLHNCRHFPMDLLKAEDPSYTELATIMRRIAIIITVLADSFDPMMGQKAVDYCNLMSRMGIAIDKGDQVELDALTAEMQRKPGA